MDLWCIGSLCKKLIAVISNIYFSRFTDFIPNQINIMLSIVCTPLDKADTVLIHPSVDTSIISDCCVIIYCFFDGL